MLLRLHVASCPSGRRVRDVMEAAGDWLPRVLHSLAGIGMSVTGGVGMATFGSGGRVTSWATTWDVLGVGAGSRSGVWFSGVMHTWAVSG